MSRLLILTLVSILSGCSSIKDAQVLIYAPSVSNNASTFEKESSEKLFLGSSDLGSSDLSSSYLGSRYTKDVLLLGIASVGLGSLALHDTDSSFKTSNERWFQEDTEYAGMDKLGHAWYSSLIADYFYEKHPYARATPKASAALASAMSLGIMSLIEVADGYAASSTGFSNNDLIADALGAGFSYLRNTNPKIKEVVDFRIEYLPDLSLDDWKTETFYSDQKYVLAWKLSGIDLFKSSLMKYFEVHTGYYARGFSDKEAKQGRSKSRNGYIGLGINLSEVLKNTKMNDSDTVNGLLGHVQFLYTYIESSKSL